MVASHGPSVDMLATNEHASVRHDANGRCRCLLRTLSSSSPVSLSIALTPCLSRFVLTPRPPLGLSSPPVPLSGCPHPLSPSLLVLTPSPPPGFSSPPLPLPLPHTGALGCVPCCALSRVARS